MSLYQHGMSFFDSYWSFGTCKAPLFAAKHNHLPTYDILQLDTRTQHAVPKLCQTGIRYVCFMCRA